MLSRNPHIKAIPVSNHCISGTHRFYHRRVCSSFTMSMHVELGKVPGQAQIVNHESR